MSLSLRWVGEEELDRVAQTRLQCYARAGKELESYQQYARDPRAQSGDILLAERDGEAVGTAASYSMTMWVRGSAILCQGVAWVGTIRTQRRCGADSEKGIATQIMHETLRKGRERNQVVSALMPFRASYYEHFGYGLVERRNEWVIPLGLLPRGDCRGMRFMKPDDLPQVAACRQRMVEQGQCNIERPLVLWQSLTSSWNEGFCVVDQPAREIRSWMYFEDGRTEGERLVRVMDATWDSHEALMRQLHFLGTLRDQYTAAQIVLPADLPLNRLLRESQLEHRPVEHPTARFTPQTRMQVRILDHVRFLETLRLPTEIAGRAKVAVHETEGIASTIQLDISSGCISANLASGEGDLECSDKVWASIACGDLSASAAAGMGLLGNVADSRALRVLDGLAIGPLPYCTEYF
jgi:predicted acetyltransferase